MNTNNLPPSPFNLPPGVSLRDIDPEENRHSVLGSRFEEEQDLIEQNYQEELARAENNRKIALENPKD